MIPLRDDNPTSTFPIVTLLLIAANVAVFLYQKLSPTGPLFDAQFAMVPFKVTTGHNLMGIVHIAQSGAPAFIPLRALPAAVGANEIPIAATPAPLWATIFTAMFMHANVLHIAGNMLFLWIFGNNVEDALGKLRFLFFYLVCGLVAAFAQIGVAPHSLIPTLGASGAIAGVLGAYIVMYPNARVLTLIFLGFLVMLRQIPAFWVLFIWIGLQVIEEVSGIGGMANGGVAYMAHIGGFFCGLLLILLFGGRSLGQRRRAPVAQGPYGY